MDIDGLRKRFEDSGVRRVKVGGFDVDGVLRGKYLSLDKFWSVAEGGFGFCDVIFGWDIADACYDNAEVTGGHTGYPDIQARVDLDSFRMLPYEADTAAFLVDFYTPQGKPHPACPRNLLKSVIARAEASGYTARVGAEFEFWIFRETPQSLAEKGFRNPEPFTPGMCGYSWLRTGQQREVVHEVLDAMEAFDIDIEGLHTETGPGVYEVAIRYADALRAADMAALFKTTLKEVLSHHGLTATFMAKWNTELPGSSGHIHQSLWDSTGETNLLADTKAEHGLSQLGLRYLAGLVQTAPELTAIYAPTINSYKRYVPGLWAPLTASWGVDNRTCAVRAIRGSASSTRLEYRQTAADINPYTAMAACLGAGLYGINHALEAPPPSQGDASETGDAPALPTDLDSAVDLLDQSDTAREILGGPFVDHFVRTRRWEVRAHRKAVTDWELARYFEAT